MKTFLYLRGLPGVGKITVARPLAQALDWKLFWFHDLKNAVQNVVQEHRIPRLMDEMVAPIIRFLVGRERDIIYVRPSPDRETVESVRQIVASAHSDHRFIVVRLSASHQTLLERVRQRADPYRIHTSEALDAYLNERQMAEIEGEWIVQTDGRTPAEITEEILHRLQAVSS